MNDSTETSIQSAFEAWLAAVKSADVDEIMAHYDPGVIAYDAILALRFQGREAYGAHWKECMAYCPDGFRFEPSDPDIVVDGDLAVLHCPVRCGGPNDQGEEQLGWMRMTMAWRRWHGQWRIAHEHSSMPFDPVTMKAMENAEP